MAAENTPMALWEFILLGVVQGISEFLPISSDGHLVLVEAMLGHTSDNLELNIALHFGTLLSILVVFRNQLIPVLKSPRMMGAIIVATLPVVVAALLFKEGFKWASEKPLFAAFGLVYTSILLFITPKIDMGQRDIKDIRYIDALIIGIFQALAPLPGVSRSGSTIVAAQLMGYQRAQAANFSFYIAVPALIGATVMMLKDVVEQGGLKSEAMPTAIGAGVAFVVGIVALKSLLSVVAARKLVYFAWYVLIVAIITFIAVYLGKI
ncbi:undecaprenyl-diphosphate phosphatase [Planctomicrobium sp. SH668]|uniref:undecaprenyl-diphosphate phosphatase n=1 Tax=Planctomicrobium sp. SH668 TaxID=3448126 RepID=UPI003F5C0F01